MRVRALTAKGDMQFGRGESCFYTNQPEGVAQNVLTRLQLYLGEWYLNLADGTAWRTQVLGKYTAQTRDMVIRSRVAGTQGVKEITAYQSRVDRNTRGFFVQVRLDTPYGGVALAAVTSPDQTGLRTASYLIDASGNLLTDSNGNLLSAII